MISFPNAKINLGLKVVSKRPDGFHDIESVFLPISLRDVLEIIPAKGKQTNIKTFGLEIPGKGSDNLCIKAWELLRERYNVPHTDIFLYKNIPIGAGLGGGSSDAAFTLKLLNNLYELGLNDDDLENYARMLGSDCAFFIKNKPVLAEGKGDVFSPANVTIRKYILLVVPPIHVSTPWSYQQISPRPSKLNWMSLSSLPYSSWKNILSNDFEKPVMETYPIIASIKDKLYKAGASYVSMSGSGAAVYGLFDAKPPEIPEFPECFTWHDQIEF